MPEVASLSSKLLERLEAATHNVDINDQIIGEWSIQLSFPVVSYISDTLALSTACFKFVLFCFPGSCFLDFSEDITLIYGSYCRNHDDAIAFLEKVS